MLLNLRVPALQGYVTRLEARPVAIQFFIVRTEIRDPLRSAREEAVAERNRILSQSDVGQCSDLGFDLGASIGSSLLLCAEICGLAVERLRERNQRGELIGSADFIEPRQLGVRCFESGGSGACGG